MNNIKLKAANFIDGNYYPYFIAIFVLLGHLFSLEEFFLGLIFVSAVSGFILCDNLKFLISPFLFTLFTISQKSVSTGRFFTTPYKIILIICGVIFFGAMIAHFIIYKINISSFKQFRCSKLFWGYIFMAGAFLTNGFSNFEKYTPGNIIYALALVATLCASFALFSINLHFNKDIKEYFLTVLYLASLIITIEFFALFINQIQFQDNGIVKESIMIGWGMWNNIGGMLTMLLPVHFYLAATQKHSCIFYVTGILSYIAIVLSLSRSSLLISTLIIGICIIVLCFIGKNKKFNRIIFASLSVIGSLGILVFWNKVSHLLGDYLARGFSDNGRFEMYRHGINNFLSHPLFGAGFYNSYATEHQFITFLPYRYHNTLIELIATCGIVGFAAYAYHRFQTIKLFLLKKSCLSFFFALSISGLLLTSLLDNHMFNLYPCIYYSLILLIVEKTESDKKQTVT